MAATSPIGGDSVAVRQTIQARYGIHRGDLWRAIVLGLLCFLMIAPLIMAIVISFKSPSQFARVPFIPTLPLQWANYQFAVEIVSQFLLNSIFVSGVTLVGVLVLSSLAAYAFTLINFPGRTVIFYGVLALMMVPEALTLVPSFVLVKDLGLINTHGALILPWISGGQIIGILILRSFFEGLPSEMFAAARIDGASDWQIYRHIALPLTKSMLGVVAILNLLGTWNNLIWPVLTLTERELYTLTPGLYSYMAQYYTSYGRVMAGLLLGALPLVILFFFTSKLFVEGLTSGAIKS